MTITVEDGSGVEDANSYIDEAFVTAFATSRGFTAPSTTELAEQYILKAMGYLNFYRPCFKGKKSLATNALAWPRTEVFIDGFEFSDSLIPDELRYAQAQLVIEQANGTPLYPTVLTSSTEGFVTQSTIGPLTEKYSDKGLGVTSQYKPIRIQSVMNFLDTVLVDLRLSTVKV